MIQYKKRGEIMPFELVREMFDSLPFEKQTEVVDFVLFLYTENKKNTQTKNNEKFPFDVFSGGMNYIAEDFDDTPEGFEDYI
jgi:hypothetical protein